MAGRLPIRRAAGRALPFLALLGLLVGCASEPVALSVRELAGWGRYEPAAYVTVLAAPPAEPYVTIARITATGAAGLTRSQALAALTAKAREVGANAVVVTDESESAGPSLSINPAGGTTVLTPPETTPKLVGLAIRTAGKAP